MYGDNELYIMIVNKYNGINTERNTFYCDETYLTIFQALYTSIQF